MPAGHLARLQSDPAPFALLLLPHRLSLTAFNYPHRLRHRFAIACLVTYFALLRHFISFYLRLVFLCEPLGRAS